MQELGLEGQRSQVLLDMQRLFASWDGTAENGMRVIAENKKYIDQFQVAECTRGDACLEQC